MVNDIVVRKKLFWEREVYLCQQLSDVTLTLRPAIRFGDNLNIVGSAEHNNLLLFSLGCCTYSLRHRKCGVQGYMHKLFVSKTRTSEVPASEGF